MIWTMILGLAIYFGGNAYLFVRLLQQIVAYPLGVQLFVSVLFWFCAVAMFLAIAMRGVAMPTIVHRLLYACGSVWMVFLLYMVLALILFDLLSIFLPIRGITVLLAFAVTSAALIYGYYNYRTPKVEYIDINAKNVQYGSSLRIVAISDVHLGYGTNREDLRRYVELINRQNPDVVVIVGDLIDNSIEPVRRDDMCAEFSHVRARMGVYMVAGNHEYISDIGACEEYLAGSVVRLVRDDVVELDGGVQLICRDDMSNRRRKSLAEFISVVDAKMPVVVLDHQPNEIELSSREGVDLHISGHTHRGQVWPISLLTDAIFEQSYGYRLWGETHAYVSSGLSLWGPPFRIGTQSELVVIDMHY